MSENMTIYLIHHSHTDIGYTDRQEKIETYHIDFIKQAIDILNRIHNGSKKEWAGFRWTCENIWQVEKFLDNANESEIKDFRKYIKSGEIDISGTYLNLTELIDQTVLNEKLEVGLNQCRNLGTKIDSAMTADINGYSWGYSEIIYSNGIRNLFSNIHSHHGMFPINQKQTPFFWETPKGNKILVWNGDHYHLGNEFIIAPNAGSSYGIQDELVDKVHTHQFEVAEKRIFRYIKNLLNEDYKFNFVPIMVSGIISDNAPPNGKIMEFVKRWNQKHQSKIKIKMSSIHEFFQILRKDKDNIPTYKGDWNDWWADGVGSTPAVVKILRDAQRKYQICKKLDPKSKLGNEELLIKARDNIMMYAEHTWGYSSSVSEPWESLVNDLEYRKSAYAINANEAISRNLDNILKAKGEVSISPEMDKVFKIINPHQSKIMDTAKIIIGNWEYLGGAPIGMNEFEEVIEVIDLETNEKLRSQVTSVARGKEIEVLINLNPGEERVVKVQKGKINSLLTSKNYAYVGADKVRDIKIINDQRRVIAYDNFVETPYFKVLFHEEKGAMSIIDKVDGKELIDNRYDHGPFMGIYERTDMEDGPTKVRRSMGRNRKSIKTNRYFSKVKDIKLNTTGDVFSVVEVSYELEGTQHFIVELKVYNDIPRISVTTKIHKDSYWEPENLYFALPFTSGEHEELFIEKTGSIIRPGIDQLPYTNKEFYLLQNGFSYVSSDKGIAVALKDTPLITMGNLNHHVIELSSENDYDHNRSPVYSWMMNNFWETNFKVDLAGFYKFEYHIFVSSEINSKEKSIEKCSTLNQGFITYRI